MILTEFIKDMSYDQVKEVLTQEPYCLHINEHLNYFLLKYNQIQSDFNIPLVRECRGIILRKDNYKVVCHPFHKFFNYGESLASKIVWNTARVEEKIDGSLIKIWCDDGDWHISTNGVIDARLAFSSAGPSYAELFYDATEDVTDKLNPENTYMFELVHPLNRIVVNYDKPAIYHIGTRNNETGEEIIEDVEIQKPKTYSFSNLYDVLDAARELPYSEEGYVVVDKTFNRIKIKSPSYVAVHHMKNNGIVSAKRILHIIMSNEKDEFLSYFPEFEKYFGPIEKKYKRVVSEANQLIDYVMSRNFETRKDYALMVKDNPFSGFFFAALDGKYDLTAFEEYLRDIGAEKTSKIMGLKDIEL